MQNFANICSSDFRLLILGKLTQTNAIFFVFLYELFAC